MVPLANPLSTIDGVFNGVLVTANMVGDVMFYGPGAGKLPTASAVVADIIDIIANMDFATKPIVWEDADEGDLADFDTYECRRMFILAKDCTAKLPACQTKNVGKLIACVTDEPMSEKDATALAEELGEAVCAVYRIL